MASPAWLGGIALAVLLPGCQALNLAVPLPHDAPLRPEDCGWESDTPLAFAGWASAADFGDLAQGLSPSSRVFAIVTRDAVDLPRIGGTGGTIHGRAFCATDQARSAISMTIVPDDWEFGDRP